MNPFSQLNQHALLTSFSLGRTSERESAKCWAHAPPCAVQGR